MATVGGLLIYISHIGFENYGLLIIQTIFLSYFMIYVPNMVATIISKHSCTEWYTSKSFILLICIIILVIAGEISVYWDTMLFSLFTMLGGCTLVVSLVRYKKSHSSIISPYFCIFFFFLGICFSTLPYTDLFTNQLIKEKIIVKTIHEDDKEKKKILK